MIECVPAVLAGDVAWHSELGSMRVEHGLLIALCWAKFKLVFAEKVKMRLGSPPSSLKAALLTWIAQLVSLKRAVLHCLILIYIRLDRLCLPQKNTAFIVCCCISTAVQFGYPV